MIERKRERIGANLFGHTWELTKIRIRLAMRNRAFFFFSLVMPLIFLFGAGALLAEGLSLRAKSR